MEEKYDFNISEEYRGKKVFLNKTIPNWTKEPIELIIPKEAYYLNVNPLEDEDEFLGCQELSDKQQLIYYGMNNQYISTQDLEHQIITEYLMYNLRLLFPSQ